MQWLKLWLWNARYFHFSCQIPKWDSIAVKIYQKVNTLLLIFVHCQDSVPVRRQANYIYGGELSLMWYKVQRMQKLPPQLTQIRDHCVLWAFVYTTECSLKKNRRKCGIKRPKNPVNPRADARRRWLCSREGWIKDTVLLTGMSLGLFLRIPLHVQVLQDPIHTCTHTAARDLVRLTEGNTIPVDGKAKDQEV